MRPGEPSLRPLLLALLGILFTGLVVACLGANPQQPQWPEYRAVPAAPEGYIEAEVALYPDAAATCQVLVEAAYERFEPLSIPTSFLEDGLKVWIKISRQRRPSTCDATPCILEDIKKREP